jgi:hypothetical protein
MKGETSPMNDSSMSLLARVLPPQNSEESERRGFGCDACAYSEGVPLDWERGALAEGLVCYGSGRFFQAHEHWESVWLTLQEPEKSFLRALIQITAAFHHRQAGNRAGAVSLLRRALQRLELCPAHSGGIMVALLCSGVSEWLSAMEGRSLSIPAALPRICPLGPAPG